MKKALEMNIGGIKCDNPNCDFNDMTVKFEIDKFFYVEVLGEEEINCDRVFCPKVSCDECPLGDEGSHKIKEFEIV